MITAVKTGEADIAIGVISITTERLKTMRFSTPTYDSGLIIITLKDSLSLFWLFFQPFDYTI